MQRLNRIFDPIAQKLTKMNIFSTQGTFNNCVNQICLNFDPFPPRVDRHGDGQKSTLCHVTPPLPVDIILTRPLLST